MMVTNKQLLKIKVSIIFIYINQNKFRAGKKGKRVGKQGRAQVRQIEKGRENKQGKGGAQCGE